MDVVYICRGGDNEELRYSIRSVVKNLPHSKIWVVGDKPDWYTGNFIKVEQRSVQKYTRARNNLKTIITSKEISNPFILMNDDFYIINKINRLPVLYDGTLEQKIELQDSKGAPNGYIRLLEGTQSWLTKYYKLKNPLNYELHVPMEMTKDGLRRALVSPGLWRSTYGNIVYDKGEVEMRDVKVFLPGTEEYDRSYDIDNPIYDYLSSNDDSFDIVYDKILKDRFPDPSEYES